MKQFPTFTVQQVQQWKDFFTTAFDEFDTNQEMTDEWLAPFVEVLGVVPEDEQVAAFLLWFYGREKMREACYGVCIDHIEHINSVHVFDRIKAIP